MRSYNLLAPSSSSPTLPKFDFDSQRPRPHRFTRRTTYIGICILAVLAVVTYASFHEGYDPRSIYYKMKGSESGAAKDLATSSVHPQANSTFNQRLIGPDDYTLPRTISEPITFIPYTFGFEMLKQTVRVYHRARWENIVVIDNSWDHDAWRASEELSQLGVSKVLLTTTHMKFTGVQATMDTLSASLGHDYYLWSHSDAFLVSDDPNPYSLVRSCIDQRLEATPNLGVLFFSYDWLSMVRVKAGKAAPWDPAMMQYGADCDRYARIRLAGFVTETVEGHCPSHKERLGQLFNMNGILSSKEQDLVLSDTVPFEDRLEAVRQANDDADSYAWRGAGKGGMSEMDHQAASSNAQGGGSYYSAKWGEDRIGNCELEGGPPIFDIPRARS